MVVNLLDKGVKIKASSGLSKDAKSLLDASLETCWTSENNPQGPSSSTLTFKFSEEPVKLGSLHSLALTFAGGFTAISASLAYSKDGEWIKLAEIFPADTNARQVFPLDSTRLPTESTDTLRLSLQGSTDDYGRVTLYQLELYG